MSTVLSDMRIEAAAIVAANAHLKEFRNKWPTAEWVSNRFEKTFPAASDQKDALDFFWLCVDMYVRALGRSFR